MTTTTLLPATLVPAPDRNWAVTSLKSMETRNGVAFNGTLRLDGKIVGVIENQGNGGGTWADCRTREANEAWRASAEAYAKDSTYNSHEDLADALVNEYEIAKMLNQRGTIHVLPAGAKVVDDEPPFDFGFVSYKTNATDDQARDLARREHPGARIWLNGGWESL